MADPCFDAIMERLLNVQDDQLFEQCAATLLRQDWPNLIPVPGGGDEGMDGAWFDSDGLGLLVTTTSKDVLRNVKKNLNSHLKGGGKRRRVLVLSNSRWS